MWHTTLLTSIKVHPAHVVLHLAELLLHFHNYVHVFSWQSNEASKWTHVIAVVSFMGDFFHASTMEQESIRFYILGQIFHFHKEELPVATEEIFSQTTLGSVECILLAMTFFHWPSHASY